MDGLLKSVKANYIAIKLQHDVISMCASGGFRLTKIISHSIKIFQSVPESERRNEVKNVYFNNRVNLLTEKALGINWNRENDHIGFNINLDGKPLI